MDFKTAVVALALSTLPAPVLAMSADCPLRFDSHTVGLPRTCLFVGRYNPSCGGAMTAVFAGDGEVLVIGLAAKPNEPVLYIPARALTGTEGKMVRWRPDLDTRADGSVGSVELSEDGRTLRLRPNSTDLKIGDCRFDEYVGHFVEMVDAAEPAPSNVNATAPGYW